MGGKRRVWLAFDRYGEVAGVYSKESLASEVSTIVREFRMDKVPT